MTHSESQTSRKQKSRQISASFRKDTPGELELFERIQRKVGNEDRSKASFAREAMGCGYELLLRVGTVTDLKQLREEVQKLTPAERELHLRVSRETYMHCITGLVMILEQAPETAIEKLLEVINKYATTPWSPKNR